MIPSTSRWANGIIDRTPLQAPASTCAQVSFHVIEKESLKFKDLEHVGIEEGEQLFRDMLIGRPGRSAAFARRSFVADAGASVEDRGGKLEINQAFLLFA
jgi:hypothetical protein